MKNILKDYPADTESDELSDLMAELSDSDDSELFETESDELSDLMAELSDSDDSELFESDFLLPRQNQVFNHEFRAKASGRNKSQNRKMPPPGTVAPTDRPDWIEWSESPYKGSRGRHTISAIIYHYTGGPRLNLDKDSHFKKNVDKRSAHYVIGKDGRIVQMVPDNMRANHAGKSTLAGREGVNARSIGIEIVNLGYLSKEGNTFYWKTGSGKHKYMGTQPIYARGRYWEPFTGPQYASLIRLTRHLTAKHPGIAYITGHEDIAPGRKQDPGGAFDWNRIRQGLGTSYRGHLGPLKKKTSHKNELEILNEWIQDEFVQ